MMASRILVVEDDESVRDLVTEILVREGYQTVAAGDGSEALEKFALEEPDLLITDFFMPQMDGYELCRQVRQSSSLPILLISGESANIGEELARQAGADAFLAKPSLKTTF